VEAFLICLGSVAIAEMGDRTQLLSLVLAARYKRPWPILAGVLCATLANHGLAAAVGASFAKYLQPRRLDLAVGVSMTLLGLWALIPDKLDDGRHDTGRTNVFITTCAAFFVAEIGDKTQFATVALAAAYPNLGAVVAGTTCGMLLANAPVIFLGRAFAARLPLRAIRLTAALLFVVIGAAFVWRALHA
jgi:putative Ca2+/H+ antiporter (TMEM165/GDT1 family)